MVAAFTVAGPIFNFLAAPLAELLVEHGQKPELIYTGLQQGFLTQVRISVFGGFVLAFPVISYQLWRFVAPGPLPAGEAGVPAVPDRLAGAVPARLRLRLLRGCCRWSTTSSSASSSSAPAGRSTGQDVDDPVSRHDQRVSVADHEVHGRLRPLLPAAGGADADGDGRARHRQGAVGASASYAVVLMLVVAAFVTPGPDVMSQLILFAAIYPLYEISILLVRFFERKREAELRAQGLWDEEAEAGQGRL